MPDHPSSQWAEVAKASLLVAVLAGCGEEKPEDLRQQLRAHALESCPIPTAATLDLTALGDFGASLKTGESLPADSRGRELTIPLGTRAVSLAAEVGGDRWWGAAELDARGDLDVLLWSRAEPCTLGALGAAYPVGAGEAVGHHPSLDLVVIAGGLVSSPDAARAVVVDLRTGDTTEVSGGIVPARALATITPFGDRLLLAGGIDPRERPDGDFDLAAPLASASLFDPATRSFDRTTEIPISPRARHAAVTLVSGETLLVGGSSLQSPALASVEAVSPEDQAARIVGLTQLQFRRRLPQALVLDDGRVFVGGGVDESRRTVEVVEWLSADASEHLGSLRVVASENARFAPLPVGAVLGVGVCPEGAPGCDAATAPRQVTWFDRQQRAHQLDELSAALVDPQLFAGTRGAPRLVTGAGAERTLLQFSPWERRFSTAETVPRQLPTGTPLTAAPGLLLWAEAGRVRGYRDDVRSRFARDVGPQLLATPGLGAAVVPSSPPEPGGAVEFAAGGLTLRSEGRVRVSDAEYLDLEVRLDWRDGAAPRVLLGGAVLGGDSCSWPSASAPVELRLERVGGEVTLHASGATRGCRVEGARLPLSIAAATSATSVLRSFEVSRLP